MITESHQHIHEFVVAQYQSKRQRYGIERYSYRGLRDFSQPSIWMLHSDHSAQKCSFEHECTGPTYWGHYLVSDSFVTPNKHISFSNHSPEKILIAGAMKLGT